MGVIGDKPVHKQGKSYFEVQIENCTSSANIMIGFVHKKENPEQGYYTK